MTKYLILTDNDVRKLLPMKAAVTKMEDAFMEQAKGTLVAPPRYSVGGSEGSLVFTIGAETDAERVIGFRVYDTFPGTSADHDQAQLVAVYEYGSGRFKGLVIGRWLGAVRTGAIGGVAMDYLARKEATTLAIIGAGFQAQTQIQAALTVRNFKRVLLYNRTFARSSRFAEEIRSSHDVQVEVAESAQQAVGDADAVICTTKSPTPVLDASWIRPGTYVSSIGPKFRDAHEIPLDLVEASAMVVTDSLAQVEEYGRSYFIEDPGQLIGLDRIVTGEYESLREDDIRFFSSVGLAGTEVILANELLKRAAAQG